MRVEVDVSHFQLLGNVTLCGGIAACVAQSIHPFAGMQLAGTSSRGNSRTESNYRTMRMHRRSAHGRARERGGICGSDVPLSTTCLAHFLGLRLVGWALRWAVFFARSPRPPARHEGRCKAPIVCNLFRSSCCPINALPTVFLWAFLVLHCIALACREAVVGGKQSVIFASPQFFPHVLSFSAIHFVCQNCSCGRAWMHRIRVMSRCCDCSALLSCQVDCCR